MNYFAIPGLKRDFVNYKVIFQKDLIIDTVCKHFEISKTNLFKGGRYPKFAHPRFICYMLLQKHTAYNKCEIGEIFNMDHTSVIHGIKKIKKMMAENHEIGDHVAEIHFSLFR